MEQNTKELCDDYKLLVDSASQAIGVAQDGVFKYSNKRASELSGYTSDELNNKPFLDIVHVGDRQKVSEYYMKRIKEENVPEIYDFKFVKKSGDIIWAEIHTTMVNWRGKPASLVFMDDITSRRATEEHLRQSESRLSVIFKVSPVSITLTGLKDGKIIEGNETMSKVFGYTREEAIGRTTIELGMWANQGDRDRFTEEIASGEAVNKENLLRRKNGETFWALMSAELIDIGEEKYVLTTILDIDERKRAEQKMKEQYIAMEKQDKFMVDRENRMIEMKKEVDLLLKELGRPSRYGRA